MSLRDLYFTREEMTAAWLAIRPLNCDDDVDTVLESSPVLTMIIRCKALAMRRHRQGFTAPSISHAFRLGNVRTTTVKRSRAAKPTAKPLPARPDVKQRAANDLDLFEPTEAR